MSSPSYNPSFSTSQLRQRKGFGPIFYPTPSVDAPSIAQENEQDYDESSTFNLDHMKLANIVKDKNDDYLEEVGGINGMAELLHTNIKSGIPGDVRDLCHRRNAFGSNVYYMQNQSRKQVKKSFLRFYLRDSWSWVILLVTIFDLSITRDLVMSVIYTFLNIACFMIAFKRYPLAKEIEKLLDERDELRSNVVRDGQPLQIPAYEIVVGDVVRLKRGDRAPADGLSLGTGKKYYYMGADLIEVEDTRMLVTSVGESTKFGQRINVASNEFHEMTSTDVITKSLFFLLQIPLKSQNRWFIQKKQNESVSHRVEIVVQNDNDARFSGFDLEGLRELVMEKNCDALSNQFGGADSVVDALKSHRENGISGDVSDLHQRISLFGSNTFQLSHNRGVFLQYLLKALFGNPCFPIWFPHALNLCIKFKVDGLKELWSVPLAIFLLTLCICIAIAQAERARHCHPSYKLKEYYIKAQVEVVRNGQQKCISICEVVMGDIVRLRKGSLVPADGLFLDGGYLQLEGMSAQINQENPFMLFGGKVSYGWACMLVTCVGKNSSWAKKINSVTCPDIGANKPLQMNFKKSVSLKEKVDLISAIIIPSILLVKSLLGKPGNKDGLTDILLNLWATLMKYMFPASMETYWLMPLLKDKHMNAVLRKESSNMFDWITSGRVTTIITDEKSMLVQKHMEVVEFRLNDVIINVSSGTPPDVLEALQIGLGLRSSNSMSIVSPTDETLFSWGELELGINKVELSSTYTIENCVSSDEEKLTWTSIKKENGVGRARYLHCKGDAWKLLSKCDYYHEKDGAKKSLDEVGKREKIKQVIGDMQANGLTCVALAHKCTTEGGGLNEVNQVIEDDGRGSSGETECIEDDGRVTGGEVVIEKDGEDEDNGPPVEVGASNEIVEANEEEGIASSEEAEVEEDIMGKIGRGAIDVEQNGLTLIGLVGIRQRMRDSVESLQKMGVKVKMVWMGDDRSNAVETARVCGIVAPNQNEDEVIVEAETFRNCSDEEEKRELVRKMCVIVSSSSLEKSQLVEYLKKNNEVVAVVGSREDDARVLQEADIGFSMQSGSVEAVKERANFLVLDDSFTSIVMTLKMTRRYYFNFIRFTKIQLGVIFPVFILNFAAAIFTSQTPISDFMLYSMGNPISSLIVGLTDYQSLIIDEQLKKLPSGRNEVMIPIKVMYVVQVSLVTLVLLLVNFLDGDTVLGVRKRLIIIMSLYLTQICPWKIIHSFIREITVDEQVVTNPDTLLRVGSELVYHRLPWKKLDVPYLLQVLYEEIWGSSVCYWWDPNCFESELIDENYVTDGGYERPAKPVPGDWLLLACSSIDSSASNQE